MSPRAPRVGIVTGASRGIGRAVAETLAVEGDGLPDRDAMLADADVAEAVRWVLERPPHVRVPYLPIARAL